MNSIKVFVEIGKKRIFAGAVDWPGWCRSGRDEKTALQALIDYGPRYAQVLRSKEIEFHVPTDGSDFIVTERHAACKERMRQAKNACLTKASLSLLHKEY